MLQQWYLKHIHNLIDNHELDVESLDQSLNMVRTSATEMCKEAVNAVQAITGKLNCNSDIQE